MNRTHFDRRDCSDHRQRLIQKRKRIRFHSLSMKETVPIIDDDRSKGRGNSFGGRTRNGFHSLSMQDIVGITVNDSS